MEFPERKKKYEAIEKYRKRPLIVYATSTRVGVPAQMAADAVREFIDQIDAISDSGSGVDILIHSTGGDALTAWKLMSILRERFDDEVAVLVPFMAFSAATIFALGADEIVMHPNASLGPIDPQITISLPGQEPRNFSYEEVGAFLRFLQEDANISEQVYVSSVIEKLFAVVDPVHVGAAKRASELSSSVGERLLLTHMKGGEEALRAKEIASELNKSFYAHGDAISRSRAKELNLKISAADKMLEGLIWEAYIGLESYLELRKPFQPLHHLLSNQQAADALTPASPLVLPPNTPPKMVEQLWNQVAQQAVRRLDDAGVEVEYSLVNAVIESTKVASEFRSKGKLSASRSVGGEIQLSHTQIEAHWRKIES